METTEAGSSSSEGSCEVSLSNCLKKNSPTPDQKVALMGRYRKGLHPVADPRVSGESMLSFLLIAAATVVESCELDEMGSPYYFLLFFDKVNI